MTVDALTAVRMPTPIQLEQAKPGRTPRQPAGTAASAPEKARNDAASAERAEETLSFEKAGELLDEYLQRFGRTLEFHVDPATGRPVVRVLDLHTGSSSGRSRAKKYCAWHSTSTGRRTRSSI